MKKPVEKNDLTENKSNKIRLSKFMASCGVASRRASEELIFAGKVKVNGEIVKLPQTLVDENDTILIDNQETAIKKETKKVYYILNKPAGYICTNLRTNKSKIVLDLFKDVKERLFTVGRLDKDTTGLLIVTNDGHFANSIIHPSKNINKEYLVKTNHEITHDHLVAISNGTLVEGTFVKPVRVTKVRKGTIKIVISEGKKRQVRLILEAVGLQVTELTRIRIGGLTLGTLEVGKWREMTDKDKKLLFE